MSTRTGWCAALVLAAGAVHAAATPLPVRSLASGAHSGVMKPERTVVRSAAAWSKLWVRHQPPQPLNGQVPPLPKVDFTREMVLAAFMGTRPTGGHVVRIQAARVEGKALTVTVVETKPGPDALTTQELTAPFHFVAVKRSALPVRWKVAQAVR